MAMRAFDPESTATRFLSYEDIKQRYRRAKRRFYTRKRLYHICRTHCKYGGKWPRMTRDAKAKVYESARECRAYQQLKQHLDAKRAAISLG
jgi:hypothetical protein